MEPQISAEIDVTRRDFMRRGAAGATGVFVQTGARMRPNILYIHSHDTGRYIQSYGHAVPTPHFERLAEAGMLFRQAFNAAPTCSPSRASLLTGQCPHSNGMLGLAHRGFVLNDYGKHILHTLRKASYLSVLAGVQHIARKPEVMGYDQILRPKSNRVADVVPVAVEFLNRAAKQPFFLDVGFTETHREFHKPGPAEDARYCLPPAPLPDAPRTRQDIAAFKASARVLDQGVGEVLKALEANGLTANTLVISTTDHGIPFPTMKCNLTDHGTGVMLILRGPGGFSGGKVCDAMVSHIDLFPTICDLLEIERPAWLEGKSMMPLVRGEAPEVNEEIFAEVNYHAAYEPMRGVRTRRWQYIRRFDGRTRPVLPNCDDGPSKELWIEQGWRDRPVAAEQLHDLAFDPNQTRNLVADPAMRAALDEMRGRLDRWMRASNDPLLKGPVKAPSGATFNDPDGISPKEPVQVAP